MARAVLPARGMRHLLCVLFATTGCVTSFDFVPVAQPDLARAGHELVDAEHATVRTAHGDVKVDANSSFKHRADGVEKGPWPLRQTALDCWGSTDCKLTEPGDYTISVAHQRVDGGKVTEVVVGTLVVAGLSGLVAEHFVCFSDPRCQDMARSALIATDVVLGVTALAVLGASAFVYAVMKGLNN